MFKRRPSIFNKDSKASPSTSSLPTPSSDGGGLAAVKRRTSFFSSQKSSTTSFSTNTTTLPSGVSTPGSTGAGGLERSNSLPGIAPPELRKRADSSDGSGSASERSSLEDLRRQVHEEEEGDHEEKEGREGLIGRENGRRREEEEEEGHDEEKHDSVASLPPPSSSASAASRSPLPPSASSLPTSPHLVNGNGNGHLPVPPPPSTNGAASPSPSSPLPPAIDIPSSPSVPAPSPSPSSPSHPSHPHHHHHHSHSPPLAAPPPLRATTISALTPPPSSAASSITQPKKRSFMSMGNGKAKKEAAAAAALLAAQEAQRILDEMTPAQKIERAKQAERAHLLQTCMELGVEIFDIAPDGHCLYAAIADQLWILRLIKEEENKPETTRLAASTYMLANPDSFLPFLVGVPADPDEEPEEGEDPNEPLEEDGMMTMKGFHRYCKRVRESGEWGGEPEILALSRYYQIPIHVVQSNHPKIVAHSPDPKANATLDAKAAKKIRAVRISYHRRLYGLGEHYNSLRKIQYTMTAFSAMVPM